MIPPRSYVETEHGTLGYCRAGDGPPVILIHGALSTADDMVIALMKRLSADYDIIAFDRPGHGASDQTSQDAGSPYIQGDAITAGWLALGIDRPVVVGHSFGGAVALSLAISRPDDVTGVIALAPICFPELRLEQVLFGPRSIPGLGLQLASGPGRVADFATLPLLRNTMFLPQVMPSDMADMYPFAWASAPTTMMANGQDSLGIWRGLTRSACSYASCRTSTHIIAGTHDLVVKNIQHGLAASRLMPCASFEWIWGSGHMLHHFHQDIVEASIATMCALRRNNDSASRLQKETLKTTDDRRDGSAKPVVTHPVNAAPISSSSA